MICGTQNIYNWVYLRVEMLALNFGCCAGAILAGNCLARLARLMTLVTQMITQGIFYGEGLVGVQTQVFYDDCCSVGLERGSTALPTLRRFANVHVMIRQCSLVVRLALSFI